MIEVRNNKYLINAVNTAKKNTIIFFDEDGTDIKYGKSKIVLELIKLEEENIKKKGMF